MSSIHWIGRSIASCACLCFLQGPSYAQSFDCRKAATAVERAICGDPNLGSLDEALAITLRDALSASPEQQDALLSSERRWIVDRDRHCGKSNDNEKRNMNACLAAEYHARIAELGAKVTEAATASCQKIADRYRPVAKDHPGESPLRLLASLPKSGISLSGISIGTFSDLVEWGKSQTPPIEVTNALVEAVQQAQDTGYAAGSVERLPNSNFYSVTWNEGGSMICYRSLYFDIVNGRTRPIGSPPGIAGEDPCALSTRSFGSIDDVPVFFQEDYNWRPEPMSSKLTVATWKNERFIGDCTISFSYSPLFNSKTLNDWEEQCTGTDCDELRHAALRIAEAVQKSPRDARNRFEHLLSADQRVEYDTELSAINAAPGSGGDLSDSNPNVLTDESPLRLPYVLQGRVYLVSAGHFTIGWRIYADWSIKFFWRQDGKLAPRAALAVGMWKQLESLSIGPTPIRKGAGGN